MSVMAVNDSSYDTNKMFYTADGMRFEFPRQTVDFGEYHTGTLGNCGSQWHDMEDKNETMHPPCLAVVDVNGDRKPNKANKAGRNTYAKQGEKLLKDVFTILITEERAVPFGWAAQRAMYQAQK